MFAPQHSNLLLFYLNKRTHSTNKEYILDTNNTSGGKGDTI
jgi:hypothetical protein